MAAGRGLEETATSGTIESARKILSPALCLVPDSDGVEITRGVNTG